MRPRRIEECDVFFDYPIQLRFAHNEQMIKAFPPHAAQKPLTNGIGPWRTIWGAQHLDGRRSRHEREVLPELGIVVANQEAGRSAMGRRLTQLLRNPGISGMPRNAEVYDAPRRELNNEKHIDGPEEQVDHREKVASPDVLGMILQEGVPILGRGPRWSPAPQVSLDGVLGYAESEFEEFAADAFGAPERILGCH